MGLFSDRGLSSEWGLSSKVGMSSEIGLSSEMGLFSDRGPFLGSFEGQTAPDFVTVQHFFGGPLYVIL